MSQSPPPGWRPGPDEERPSWMGAPGYQPYQELPPHAPMPGAPPYPAGLDHPPAPVGQAAPRTSYWKAVGATAIGAALHLVLIFSVTAVPADPRIYGAITGRLIVPIALGSLVLWLIARKRAWAFWLVAVVGVLLYFAFALVLTVVRIAPTL